NPAAIAIVDGKESITYAELRARADRIACDLQRRGIRRGSLVSLPAERSARFVSTLLGIVKAGAAYVPIAPDEPEERAESMRAQCATVLDFDTLPATADSTHPDESATPTDPAYVLFTSGSTGVPKGVVVPHIAVSRLALNNEFAPPNPGDVIAFASNACFDAATFEIWGALLNGATLAVVPRELLLSSTAFPAFLAERGVTTLFLTTALFNQIARQNPAAFRTLNHLLFGGEACNPDCVRQVLENGTPQRLVHVYGPTETTTFASWHLVRDVPADAATIPIGRPIANTSLHILDSRLDPAPVGVIGEIFIGGPGVATGYLNDPALTAERFVSTQSGRLYRTGDLARRLANGDIEFCARADSQFKLRGFRIEPGEIEAALEKHPAILHAAAVARPDSGGGRILVGYLVGRSAERPGAMALREFLSKRLPGYMIPGAFAWLDRLPLTANGKLNHQLLPEPAADDSPDAGACIHPRTPVEQQLTELWTEVLGRKGFSVRDDFFLLGGHSLLALRMLAEIRSRFGVEVPARRLFETPTVEGLGQFIAGQLAPHSPAAESFRSLIVIQRGDLSRTPLFLIPGGWGGEIEFLVYGELSRHLDRDQPVWGLKARGAGTADPPHRSVREMAADYLKEIVAVQPHGPYLLAGECVGGICASEIACQLEERGEQIALLLLFDTTAPSRANARQYIRNERRRRRSEFWNTQVAQRIRHHLGKMTGLSLKEKMAYLADRTTSRKKAAAPAGAPVVEQHPRGQKDYPGTLMKHTVRPYRGKVTLLLDEEFHRLYGHFGWDKAPIGGLEVHVLPGDHLTYIREHARTAAAKVRELIQRATASFSK
ncbi:MAG: AMP-binding protein, partial [Chthoniobacteraceae bacterium]